MPIRLEYVSVVVGNGEVYLQDWNTSRWEATLAQRRQRPDPPDHFLPYVAAGQVELSPDDLAWLRAVPEELVLSGGRSDDVYVCHGMPGNVFATIWDTGLEYTPDFSLKTITAALSRPTVAGADVILCGHTYLPLVQRTALPGGRTAQAVHGGGYRRSAEPGMPWRADYVLIRGGGIRGVAV